MKTFLPGRMRLEYHSCKRVRGLRGCGSVLSRRYDSHEITIPPRFSFG
jgi:hypothetical protein